MTTVTAPARTRVSRFQRRWLVVYWLAPPVVLLLLVQALFSFNERSDLFTAIVALVLASISMALGLLFATRIARSGADDVTFVRGTTTVRVIAVAWLLIVVAIVSGTVVLLVADVVVEAVDWSGGFASTVGSLSILAIIGPGYAEYREALKQAKSEREHAA